MEIFERWTGGVFYCGRLDEWSIPEATSHIRAAGIRRVIWVGEALDRGLLAFLCNFGVTSVHQPAAAAHPVTADWLAEAPAMPVLVVGATAAAALAALQTTGVGLR